MLRLTPKRSAATEENAATPQVEEARQGSGRQHNDLRHVLDRCCRRKQLARLHVLHADETTEGVLSSLNGRELRVRVPAESGRLDLPVRAICCVSFADDDSHGAFLTLVEDVRKGADGVCDVTLSMPSEILTTNLRESFRVPIVAEMGLRVTLQTADGKVFAPRLNNIATTGMQVAFPQAVEPKWPLGTRLVVDLQWHEEHLALAAEVRRRSGARYGLTFVHEPAHDERHRRETLRRLVQRVQQHWLKVRVI